MLLSLREPAHLAFLAKLKLRSLLEGALCVERRARNVPGSAHCGEPASKVQICCMRALHRPKEAAKGVAPGDVRVPGGAVAQMGERCNRTAEVRGSIPLGSTTRNYAADKRGKSAENLEILRPTVTSVTGMDAMCTYLDQVGSTYYFRRVVPLELRPFILTRTGAPRSEWKVSLGTKDRETAKRLIPSHTLAADREIDAARAALAAGHAQNRPAQPAQPRLSRMAAYDARRFQYEQEAAEIDEAHLAEKEARWEAREPLRQRLRDILKKTTAEMRPEEAAIYDLLSDARFDATVAEERLLSYKVSQAENEWVLPEHRHPPSNPAPTLKDSLTLNAIVTLWATERKVQAKTRDAHRAVVGWFHDRVGEKPVAEITRKDVLDFKAKLIEEGTSLANTKVKISRIKALLGWAAENDHVSENVAAGIVIRDTEAARNKRREFDLASLNLIFGTDIYTAGARPVRGKGNAAYWLPLLALHTGARLEELGQLRPSDVQEITYPDAEGKERTGWFLRLREDEGDNLRLKNASSERDVPVHPELIRLGVLDFLKSIAGKPRLFPDLKADKYGRLTAKWGEWFGLHIRALGVTDKRLVFHSFRHTFKQYARHAGIEEGVQRGIMGHSSGDVADQYGSGYPLHSLVSGMTQYRVPGLRQIERWTKTVG